MKIKGMLTHVNKFNPEQRLIFNEYAIAVLNNKYHRRPDFLNRAYTISIKKISELFGSIEEFLCHIGVKNNE